MFFSATIRRYFMAIKAYYDGSFHNFFMILAGFSAPAYVWTWFEVEWKHVLDSADVKCFPANQALMPWGQLAKKRDGITPH
jgi:hypothetical protein